MRHGKTVQRGNLAIWMSDAKSPNLDEIVNENSGVDVLLFKQAIAVGWDCPRAAILVIFRETKKLDFTIQVIGRIMRMPQQRHYVKNPELNYGYIFTNLEKVELVEEYVKDYASKYHLERDDKRYVPLRLPSTYLKRQRERTRLSGKFSELFRKAAEEKGLEERIELNTTQIVKPLIVDGEIANIDESISIEAGGFGTSISEVEIQRFFDLFVINACKPFAPFDSSDRLKTAIYNWLYDKFDIEKLSTDAQIAVVSDKNIETFNSTIQLAKEKYRDTVVKNISNVRESVVTESWEVPREQSIGSAEDNQYKKSIMKPQYVQIASNTEREFIKTIDRSDRISWWYKNGQSEIKYFAIPYVDEFGLEWSFYADFIIMFKDGTVGIFDTKSGATAEKAKHKAEALSRYTAKNSTGARRLAGGIVIPSEYGWKYNDNDIYEYDPSDLTDWKSFEGLISN